MSKKPFDADTFLNQEVKGSVSPDFRNPNLPDDSEIESLFEEAFENYPDSDFLESIYEQWEKTNTLTDQQFVGLYNSANRIRRGY